MWVWLSDPRTTWFRCLHPTPETTWWDHCQYYVNLCTHCLQVDRAHDPFHSFPCCGVYGIRRDANGPAMTLTQVAGQVARLRPGYAFITGKSFFLFLLDVDPLRRLRGGPYRWVSQTRVVSKSSMWVVTNPLSGNAIGGSLVLHHLRTLSLRPLFVFHICRCTNPLSGDAFGRALVWTLNHLFVCRHRSCILNFAIVLSCLTWNTSLWLAWNTSLFCRRRSCVRKSAMPIMVGRNHYTIGNGTVPGCRVIGKTLVP